MVHVFIPPLLRDATGGQAEVDVEATSVRQVIASLESQFPGIRSRLCQADQMRPGIAVAINGSIATRGLLQAVPGGAEVHFLPALAGG
ncbi:MAG: MoaD/ThiS family protein [Planctomycetes bacterium]|nr:MoaD/ThiS family protein [Planctomycetota bacterium]